VSDDFPGVVPTTIANLNISDNTGTIRRDSPQDEREERKSIEFNGSENGSSKKPRGKKLDEQEIIRLINEKYQQEETNKEASVIYKDNKVFDQPKRAVYGI